MFPQEIESSWIKWHRGLNRSGLYYSYSLCLEIGEYKVAKELVLTPGRETPGKVGEK